jgi:FtsZ-interacting cell division protein YlmF
MIKSFRHSGYTKLFITFFELCVGEKERERERLRDSQRDSKRERERERERQQVIERDREREYRNFFDFFSNSKRNWLILKPGTNTEIYKVIYINIYRVVQKKFMM